MDATKNFAKGTVSAGYDAGDTSIVLTTGHSARFPAVPFNAVWWNATDYPDPTDDPYVEIIRVTNIATETWTISRAQESSIASAKSISGRVYKVIAGMTSGLVDQLLPNTGRDTATPRLLNVKIKNISDGLFYAVGIQNQNGEPVLYIADTGEA